MSSLASVGSLLVLVVTLSGCANEEPSQSPATSDVRTSALAPGKRSRTSLRALDSSLTVVHRRPVSVKANVDTPIAFDRPAGIVLATTTPVVSPGTETPTLPVGPGIQRPKVVSPVAVVCLPAPAMNLDCPADAPTPSTCSSGQGLPAGCQKRVAPAVIYPANAVPACCP